VGFVLELVYVGGGIAVCVAAVQCPYVYLCWLGVLRT
jgi:hypothetical protein